MSSFDTGTKNLPYRPGFPTPAALPGTTACRVFRIPADDDNGTWQATFMGLLMLLSDPANWVQQSGGLDAETCAERWLEMLDNAYDTAEFGCAVTFPAPGDEQVPVFRLNASTGHLEQLNEQQEWEEPSGVYAVPPIPEREGTETDAKCLAAANCANVLETLYETITDGIADELTTEEILAAVVTAFVAAVGWGAAAGILFSLGFIGLVIIGAVVAVIELLSADVWDETFTDTLRCLLYACATYDAGVVTFDYECVVNALAAQTDLTLDQLRLFGQLVFIINAIGGADGLNQAGATTEITTATCDCGVWCYRWNDPTELADGGWTHETDETYSQHWGAAFGAVLTSVEFSYTWNGVDGSGASSHVYFMSDSVFQDPHYLPLDTSPGSPYQYANATGLEQSSGMSWGLNTNDPEGGGVVTVGYLELRGIGTMPEFHGGHVC